MFISYTSELRDFPAEGSYVAAAERAVSVAGHVIVNMAGFPAAPQPAAQECVEQVLSCQVYVGVLGTRYGSAVRDNPEVSYTELEFNAAGDAKLPQLMFLLDTDAADVGIPTKELIDRKFGDRQDEFRQRVRDSPLTSQSFTSPAELGQLVERALRDLARKQTQAGGTQDSAGEAEPNMYALAGRAQQRWQDALAALRGPARTMDRIHLLATVQPEVNLWEYVDQQAVHRRVAGSITELTVDLESQSEQLFQVVKEAKGDVDQLREAGYVQLSSRLTSMIESVSDLKRASTELLGSIKQLINDLHNRGNPFYDVPSENLSRARNRVEDASNEAASVIKGLQLMQAGPSPAPPPDQSAERPPGQGPAPPGLDWTTQAAAQNVAPQGEAGAGPGRHPAGADAAPVWVPPRYARRKKVFSVRVKGDSMIGDGLRDGDYVIVDPREEVNDGDIAVVLVGTQDLAEAMVKRLWHDGATIRLESANPEYGPMTFGPQDNPQIAGKVTGVFRPMSP